MRKLLFYFPLLVLLAAASCRKTGDNPTAVVDPTSPAAARVQLTVLRDTVNSRWKQMMDSDNQKLVATTAVLQMLKQLPGTDKAQADQLRQANDQLLSLRYDQNTMAESAKIDAYDNAQTQVLSAVLDLAQPQLERSQDIEALTATIREADNQVVGYRIRYDQAAKNYNRYLQMHAETLRKAGRKYANLQPLPLFELKP